MSSIIDIQKEIESFGSDSLKVCGGTYEGGIRLQQIPDEIAPLINYLMNQEEPINTVLEIGSASGAMSFILHHFLNTERTIIIDDNRHKQHRKRKETLKGVHHTEFIGDSHSQEAYNFINDLDLNYDIIIIDGDHSYEGVKKDTEMYFDFSEYHGYIIYHDIQACPGVKKYYDELLVVSGRRLQFDMMLKKEYLSKEHTPLGLALFKSYNFRLPRGN